MYHLAGFEFVPKCAQVRGQWKQLRKGMLVSNQASYLAAFFGSPQFSWRKKVISQSLLNPFIFFPGCWVNSASFTPSRRLFFQSILVVTPRSHYCTPQHFEIQAWFWIHRLLLTFSPFFFGLFRGVTPGALEQWWVAEKEAAFSHVGRSLLRQGCGQRHRHGSGATTWSSDLTKGGTRWGGFCLMDVYKWYIIVRMCTYISITYANYEYSKMRISTCKFWMRVW